MQLYAQNNRISWIEAAASILVFNKEIATYIWGGLYLRAVYICERFILLSSDRTFVFTLEMPLRCKQTSIL